MKEQILYTIHEQRLERMIYDNNLYQHGLFGKLFSGKNVEPTQN